MDSQPSGDKDRKKYAFSLALAGLVGQVGCVTLTIILAALFLGLWLDSRFGSKPVATLILLVVSIPVSVVVMLFIVRKVTEKIKPGLMEPLRPKHKEESLGKDS